MTLVLPLEAKKSYELSTFDGAGSHVIDQDYAEKCLYSVKEEDEEFLLYALYEACGVRKENGSFSLDVQLSFPSEGKRVNRSYSMVCEQPQSDTVSAVQAGTTLCTDSDMEVPILQKLQPLNLNKSSVVPVWTVSIGKGQPMTLGEGIQKGYSFTNNDGYMMVGAAFTAEGVQAFGNGALHLVSLTLYYSPSLSRPIRINVLMICVSDLVTCNETSISLSVPHFSGTFAKLTIGTMQYYASQNYSDLSISTLGDSLKIIIPKGHPLFGTRECVPGGSNQYFLPKTTLSFKVGAELAMMLAKPTCPCPATALCKDGIMTVEVQSNITVPPLDLSTVRLRDPSCNPTTVSETSLLYNIPLSGCGTTLKVMNGELVYENEVRSLLGDRTVGVITRDSEFKLTLRCSYNESSDQQLDIHVNTLAPPASAIGQGDLVVVLRAYPDVQYSHPYGIQDYPVVKYLREPVYLEVQVLNRLDPNIKLALDDCWATGSSDPYSLPNWNIIVNGCEYEGDNDLTVFHPSSQYPGLQFPTHYKRFEVKMFTFVSKGLQLSNSIYFHCSTLICDLHKPDVEVCAKTCKSGVSVKRRPRGVESSASLHKGVVVSMAGCFSVSGADLM
ncbi:zona pellucida sperm-binding protein 2 isoform X2 [Amia ocellicauda]